MSAAAPGPISRTAQTCIRLFKSLNDLLRDENGSLDLDLKTPQILDELGRFQSWAGNTGAIQGSSSRTSLDSRLQDAPFVAKQVLDFLHELSADLREGNRIPPVDQGKVNLT